MNQEVIHEGNAKGEEMCAYEKRLVLVLLQSDYLKKWRGFYFANRVV